MLFLHSSVYILYMFVSFDEMILEAVASDVLYHDAIASS
jgi:hypothetical protein